MKWVINIATVSCILAFIASLWMKNVYLSMVLFVAAVFLKKQMEQQDMMFPPLFKTIASKVGKK